MEEDTDLSSSEVDSGSDLGVDITDSEDIRKLSPTALTDYEYLTDLEEHYAFPQIFGSQYYKFPQNEGHYADIINRNTDSETTDFEGLGDPVDILKDVDSEYREFEQQESTSEEGSIPLTKNKYPIVATITGTEHPRNIETFKYAVNPNEMIPGLHLDESDLDRDDSLASIPIQQEFETRAAKNTRKKQGALAKFTFDPEIDNPLATPEIFNGVTANSTLSAKYEENTLRIRRFEQQIIDGVDDRTDFDSRDSDEPLIPISKMEFQKKKVPKHLQKTHVGKETMFWLEVLQRGRSKATELGLDARLASKEMIHGLSLAEWLGFMEKYVLDNTEVQSILKSVPEDSVNVLHPELPLSTDPRFAKPSKIKMEDLVPDIKQTLWKLFRPNQDHTDPRVVQASIHNILVEQGLRVAAKGPITSNPFRMKPTGIQENYLMQLLARTRNQEVLQVQEKKLYESESDSSMMKRIKDSIAELALDGLDEGEPKVTPKITLPEQYRVPTIIEEIEDVLNDSDFDPNEVYRRTKDLVNKNINTLEEGENELAISDVPPKNCKVCAGKKLDPMNGGLLLQLVDDCGMVLPRRQTRLCSKHQRKVPGVVARAVAMGVFSWKEGPLVHLDPFKPVIDDLEVVPPNVLKRGV